MSADDELWRTRAWDAVNVVSVGAQAIAALCGALQDAVNRGLLDPTSPLLLEAGAKARAFELALSQMRISASGERPAFIQQGASA